MTTVRFADYKLPLGVGLAAPFTRVGQLDHFGGTRTDVLLVLWLTLGPQEGLALTVGERGASHKERRTGAFVQPSWLYLQGEHRVHLGALPESFRELFDGLAARSTSLPEPPAYPRDPLAAVLWEQEVAATVSFFSERALEAFEQERFLLPRLSYPLRERVSKQAELVSGLPLRESTWPAGRLIYADPKEREE